MRGCAQDPEWHAEGDVWVHTRLVCESLVALPAWRALDTRDRSIAFAAALLHDVAKPACTRTLDGRITSRGHSGRGEVLARRILYELGADTFAREEVARIVEVHQVPFFAIDAQDPARVVHRMSQVARPALVALVAEADARGRVARDGARLLDQIELFRELAAEQGCLDAPFELASDHTRFLYFRTPGRNPAHVAYDDTWSEVVMLSGLPGAGKDTWLAREAPGLPVVSLDALRAALDVDPDEAQGPVVAAARDAAKVHLRARRPFVWNATNLSRELRAGLVTLFSSYGARVRVVYLEVPFEEQRARNRGRVRPVPDDAIERMLARWQVPDRTEAHEVSWNGTKR
ncbi:MAG: AAA family ATPase [Deltaproteobacteria bacterium]|nr:AAA family ATPase [Deltaproteobacteria bacterium]